MALDYSHLSIGLSVGHARVSVVMNCKDGAAYVQEAVASLLAQTYTDWELVAWDDGSRDDTLKLLRSYKDGRFHVFASSGGESLAHVRQLAIDQCHGEWIAFLDQDDIWLPGKLAQQIKLADQDERCGLIYGRALRFDEGGTFREYNHRHEWLPLPEGNLYEALFTHSCFICMSTAMLRRSALAEIGPMPGIVKLVPDYCLYLALTSRVRARVVQQPVCLYRCHPKSASHLRLQEMHEEALYLVDQHAPSLPPALVKRRRLVHHSLIAYAQMRHASSFLPGLRHLVRWGSVSYFAGRPFAISHRRIKRLVIRPYWKRIAPDLPRKHVPFHPSSVSPVLREGVAGPATGVTKAEVLGTRVSISTFDGAQAFVGAMVSERVAGYVSNANVYSVMLARRSPVYRTALAGATYITSDGVPIVWLLRALGSQAERVHGDDLFFACCERFPAWRHFLVGGREGQSEVVANRLRQRYPGIQIAGQQATPIRPVPGAETERMIEAIRAARADIVWVGMGTPAQDFWMSSAVLRAGLPMVAVGSAFDVISGHSRVAPDWMKRSGLQWLFRLAQEPRRLATRYAYYNSLFLVAAAAELIRAAWRSRTSGPPRLQDKQC